MEMLASNHHYMMYDRTTRKNVWGMIQMDAFNALSARMVALSKQIQNMETKTQIHALATQVLSCGFVEITIHGSHFQCKLRQQPSLAITTKTRTTTTPTPMIQVRGPSKFQIGEEIKLVVRHCKLMWHCSSNLIYLVFVKKKREKKYVSKTRSKLGEYTEGKIIVTILIEHKDQLTKNLCQ